MHDTVIYCKYMQVIERSLQNQPFRRFILWKIVLDGFSSLGELQIFENVEKRLSKRSQL